MKKEDIIALPNENLRQKSTRVTTVDANTRSLIADMTAAGLDWEDSRGHEFCVGLAAIQVDIKKKIVILRADQEDRSNRDFVTMINPKILKTFGELESDFEGCLSVKDIYGKVPRYPKVKVSALDEQGNEFRMTAEGFMARLIQHEVDHTNGILFIDHIKDDENAFFEIKEDGKIEPLDYERHIKNSNILW